MRSDLGDTYRDDVPETTDLDVETRLKWGPTAGDRKSGKSGKD